MINTDKIHSILPGLLILALVVAHLSLGYGTFEEIVIVLLSAILFKDRNVNLTLGNND